MSIRIMTWVWAHSPYSGERLLLHLALADFANDEGVCFPSHGTLAKKARCSQGWVSQTIKQMISDRLIEVIEPAGQGRGKVGRYRLLKGNTELDLFEPIGHTSTANRSNSDASNTNIDFYRLWKQYPRKTAKGQARRAFDRVMRQPDAPTIETLCAAVDRYAAPFVSGDVQMTYCAHLATWLNGERWLDETQATSQTPAPAVPVSGEIRAAQSLAAAFVHTGRTEADLVESLASYPPDARTAALALFAEMKAGR